MGERGADGRLIRSEISIKHWGTPRQAPVDRIGRERSLTLARGQAGSGVTLSSSLGSAAGNLQAVSQF